MKRTMLSGNEAIARGAFEAGVKVASAYPGTPSTEILENITRYPTVDASWAPNEKVALEVGIGASFGGGRALVAMKHVGVNVAADPLFTLSYTGVRGGLVLVTADDPELHSSQNEQDNRNYAKFAKMPMFEPADSQEALDFTRLALEVSEQFDTPVFLRSTTRISHSKSVVEIGEPVTSLPDTSIKKDPAKFVMLPGNARKRHVVIEDRLHRMEEWACQQPFNRIEIGEGKIGVITSGVSYLYAKETLPEADILKLGMVYPLPKQLIRDFASRYDTLYVIEELDPFIEEQVRAMGIAVHGKDILPICGELTPGRLKKALTGKEDVPFHAPQEPLPNRPPNMCPGCPHRSVFLTLNRLKAFVTGDIGCYTLGFMEPLSAMDTCICMGASIGNATGMAKVLNAEEAQRIVAVIGDSTFLHTGINGLMDMVYNNSKATVLILDNRTTAMTGRQENPGSGYTLAGDPSYRIDIEALCRSVGVKNVTVVDPYDIDHTRTVIKAEMERPEVSVVIARRACMLVKRDPVKRQAALKVDAEKCTGCKACLQLGCPAIEWQPDAGDKGKAVINPLLCCGCGLCPQMCHFDAIGGHSEG
ncbi:indolepyruvate:ferredoxin oxidoreductase, alpha subunit [Syntrophotalea carbinolica DSM 2380]|uniref:Indolepyruvate oxidoreductase subunit IorA n=1 Tax=Syntrophotalea carbinolica (strain DSM 2380 / NBRC 103641 / GraBd1) TaxID=338963 RepID=Q3A495_SYNC1|nr:indolepyruvate ferredoxin oxidoreductase subunit alpha [Syntrophotalea carbinolica]ABA88812.1 indolepyruvate:ferredoxin oxidoreductase, alpha subunit [Syntrophotalea carbinolica DSM 2380]